MLEAGANHPLPGCVVPTCLLGLQAVHWRWQDRGQGGPRVAKGGSGCVDTLVQGGAACQQPTYALAPNASALAGRLLRKGRPFVCVCSAQAQHGLPARPQTQQNDKEQEEKGVRCSQYSIRVVSQYPSTQQ